MVSIEKAVLRIQENREVRLQEYENVVRTVMRSKERIASLETALSLTNGKHYREEEET